MFLNIDAREGMLNVIYLLFVMILLASESVGQEKPNKIKGWKTPDAPLNCEENTAYMDVLSNLTLEQAMNGGVLIAIAHLGDGERSREFNRRRLYNVREYVKDRTGIQVEKIVVGEGERIKGLGRVDFYLGGKMIGGLVLGRNKDLCLLCCEEAGPFYPHKDNLDKKRRRDYGKP